MSVEELISELKERTDAVPPSSRERVFQRLTHAPAPTHRYSLAFAAGVAVVLGLGALWLFRQSPLEPLRSERAVVVAERGARVSGTATQLVLEQGTVVVSTWGDPVVILVGAHRITADSAVFAATVAADGVSLEVDDGVVLVDGVAATRSSLKTIDWSMVRELEPPNAAGERHWAQVDALIRAGDVSEAAARLEVLAGDRGSGALGAEAALLKKGQLELWNLNQPARAVATFETLLARYPHGALEHDARFSLLESFVAAERWADTGKLATELLSSQAHADRVDEIEFVAALANVRLEEPKAGCAMLRRVNPAGLSARQRAAYATLSTVCENFERSAR